MKIIVALSLFISVGFSHFNASCFDGISTLQQLKNSYITLRINKYEVSQLETLLESLQSHESKIADVFFNEDTRHLTIYYTAEIKLDDIFELVMKHVTDFDKVSGTEL